MRIALTVAAFLALSTAGVSAQQRVVANPREAVPGGITEQGRATQSVQADRLRFVIRVFNNRPATPSGITAATPVMKSSDLQNAVIEAMHANGVPDAHVVEAVLGNLSSNDQITGTIPKPTRAKVAEYEKRIVTALPVEVLPLLGSVNLDGYLEADSCSGALDRARIAALRDARARAQALAAAAGMRLGDLQAANESDQTSGCGDSDYTAQLGINGGAFNNPLTDGTIDVTVNVTATFAIAP